MARAISQIAANSTTLQVEHLSTHSNFDSFLIGVLRVKDALAVRFLPVRVGPTSQLGVWGGI